MMQLLKETSDFYIETKSKKARINVEILQKQVDSVKNELNNEINKFKWLVKQEVLTEEESEQKIKEVKFYHQVDDEQRVLN